MPITATSCELPTFLAELLREQQELTAVEQFAQFHESATAPLQARFYQALLPTTPLAAGEQYAFEVNLDYCSGCKACVTACHSLNGLDEGETWREVGLLIGGTATLPVLQHVTAACHHCLEPACMNVCPTRAYEKDPVTGIVKHLDDQCFGCQYCILACPYDVPKYNPARGIVRKCDMCSDRLKVGEAPACVQACPHEAIRIAIVNTEEVAADCEANPFLPGAPDPQYTQPTTNYKTAHAFPRNMLPADYYAVHAEHAHAPLIVMLVLTQLSVGGFFVEQWLGSWVAPDALSTMRIPLALSSLLFGVIALAAATLHLGRPHLAFRAMLGLRYSWLSREILAFGLFAKAAALYAVILWYGELVPFEKSIRPLIGQLVILLGTIAVFCSAMIYHVVRREFWTGPRTLLKFFGTTAWLGISTILAVSVIVAFGHSTTAAAEVMTAFGYQLCRALICVAGLKLAYELALFQHLLERQTTSLKRSALLMLGDLGKVCRARFLCGVLGGLCLPANILANGEQLSGDTLVGLVSLIALLSIAGEFCERYLYFTAAVAPRMPGGLTT